MSNYQQSLDPTILISKISANYRPKYFRNMLLQFSWFAITNALFVTLNFTHIKSLIVTESLPGCISFA